MKIDFSSPVASQEVIDRTARQASSANSTASQGIAEDRATLSTAGQSVHSLVSQTMQTADVRQDKVSALRQQIASGEYKADPGKIAEGIIAEGGS
ncbi:MAG: flagellar biosynthesis anti-sigma factor FlgM [Acidobacteriota bacterium]